MKKKIKTSKKGIFLKLFSVIIIVGGLLYSSKYYSFQITTKNVSSAMASVSTGTSGDGLVSIADMRNDYTSSITNSQEKVRILIVPGHEPDYGGAQFGSIDERNLVVTIGQDLEQFLQTNNRYQVFITRDTQVWNPTFANYFQNNWNNISSWEKLARENAPKLTVFGAPIAVPVIHITDPTDVALRLYGIIKWANENSIDIMIHLHLNDYPGHSSNTPGKYSGLVIYTPAQQYANSSTTKAIASAIFNRLSLYNPISNLPIESAGIIDDPELIAIGANNTSNAASMLIEYEYIYEPQFVNPKVRDIALKDLAYQTYLGLQDYFNKNNTITAASLYDPTSVYVWSAPVTNIKSNPDDIYAMQTALIMDGDYPPAGKSRNDCPHSGTFGACTRAAIQAFQKKHDIASESVFGPKTFNLLKNIYDGKEN